MNAEAVLHLESNSSDAHAALAEGWRRRGNVLLERQELVEVIQLNPRDLGARMGVANLWRASKAFSAALEVMNGAPQIRGDSLGSCCVTGFF